ncbi:Metallo-peptidase family M12B Reprolysin-like-domain-containing protein [Schizophyllum amplum]|uniref:Disintegrin and metalloproteinase domain-containing protein B n=1 Tax=Schizophyllum amplum TaxID=97359 RepID=A0A550CDQ1_9AGAR|nr:Metallo-peptidase family M12B Reprolysin-like-domain-containing protein [Auriculariopsis ampla]
MLTRTFASTLVVLLLYIFPSVVAHSTASKPLARVAHPHTIALDILPRTSPSLLSKRTHDQDRSPVLKHTDSFRLTLEAFDDIFHFHLHPNEHLIHPSARIVSHDSATKSSKTFPLLQSHVLAYEGHVVSPTYTDMRMRKDASSFVTDAEGVLGWARIVVHDQGDEIHPPVFEGAFQAHGTTYHVMTRDHYARVRKPVDPELGDVVDFTEELVIFRDSDIGTPKVAAATAPQTCGHDDLAYNTEMPFHAPSSDSWGGLEIFGLSRRDDVAGSGMGVNFANSINNTDGCPKVQKVLYMGVAADCKYVAKYGTKENATQQILSDWNMASALYKSTLNVSLGIIELQVQDPDCPATATDDMPWNTECEADTGVTLNDRLSLFSQWRGDKGDDGVGLWHLMSGCPSGSEVGIAWLGTLCQQSAAGEQPQTVSGTAVSTSGLTEWQVVSHEIGHNFGAIHDCADGCTVPSTSCCPLSANTCDADAQFIMSPVAQSSEKNFSPCSIGNICAVMQGVDGSQTNTSCLIDAAAATQPLVSLQMCGNGIVEDGEDCDPGSGIDSTCCNAATCKFTQGSVCDPTNDACCTDTCAFRGKGEVCRAARDAMCDVEEVCSGNSGACPDDKIVPNGQSCGEDGLACASGQCTSVAQQCQALGASMNLTRSCPDHSDNTCRVSCQDPNNSNGCVVLTSNVIDGSPCGYGGTCASGKCIQGSVLDTAKAWYTSNLQIAIPVTVVCGLIILILLYGIFAWMRRCCTRDKTNYGTVQSTTTIPAAAPVVVRAISTRRPPPPPPVAGSMHRSSNSSGSTGSGASRRQPSRMSGEQWPVPLYNANTGQDRSNWVDESLYNGRSQERS